MKTGREAEKLRAAGGGRFHPTTGVLWILAPLLAGVAGAITLQFVPIVPGDFGNSLARYTPAIVTYMICDTRLTRHALGTPPTLDAWASRALVCEEAMQALAPRIVRDRPRAVQWRKVARVVELGFWAVLAIWLIGASLIGTFNAFFLAAAALSGLRLWFFQHLVNIWNDLSGQLDRIMDDWERWNDPDERQVSPDPFEVEATEGFDLRNPWQAR